ncbi:hypothetical protein SPRG_16416 [Saprolegnia parasitica CBS 223.65]|uniref:Uncharacterized protein n=1 Tax=Saprolegnia parasitica (strain CBS 223.65) TaxID=695850 RepID=A0A067BU27_SAPPC|nr:hypothetical protein SPRG_16416 [Saprolegnia parasitica CBS 223.65]KDO18127.1 hypothetical protein SPRG_16416 [Saprolegnia parasitica CBS 223.65]|eukprot:XP_012211163.1 hypothetical protein SPRG_16416 [Saprolegnia parasitica CBS 223.65]
MQLPHADFLYAAVCAVLNTHANAANVVCFAGAEVPEYLDVLADALDAAQNNLNGVDLILVLVRLGTDLGHAATCSDTSPMVAGHQVLSGLPATAETTGLGDFQKSIDDGRQSEFKARLAMHHLYQVTKSFTKALLDASDSDVASRLLAALVNHALDAHRDLLAALRAAIAQWSMAQLQLQPFLTRGDALDATRLHAVAALDNAIQATVARLRRCETSVADFVHRLSSHVMPSGLPYLTQNDMALRFGTAPEAASAAPTDPSDEDASEPLGQDVLEEDATPAGAVGEMSRVDETALVCLHEMQPLLSKDNEDATSGDEGSLLASSVTATVVDETMLSEDAGESQDSAAIKTNDDDVNEPTALTSFLCETHNEEATSDEPGAAMGESNQQVPSMEQTPGTVAIVDLASAASDKSQTSSTPACLEADDELEYEIIRKEDEGYFFEPTPSMAVDAPYWLNIHYC